MWNWRNQELLLYRYNGRQPALIYCRSKERLFCQFDELVLIRIKSVKVGFCFWNVSRTLTLVYTVNPIIISLIFAIAPHSQSSETDIGYDAKYDRQIDPGMMLGWKKIDSEGGRWNQPGTEKW